MIAGDPYAGFDRHTGEIAGFHLDGYAQWKHVCFSNDVLWYLQHSRFPYCPTSCRAKAKPHSAEASHNYWTPGHLSHEGYETNYHFSA